MTPLFVDTGAFLGRYVRRDQHHQAAQEAWRDIARSGRRLLTSNFVLDEVITLLARRADYAFAVERARRIFGSTSLEILRPDVGDEAAALKLFAKFADHQVSFTDAMSFALMKRHGLSKVFTFDRDFADAGFSVWPGD